jgi:hypothetical protein
MDLVSFWLVTTTKAVSITKLNQVVRLINGEEKRKKEREKRGFTGQKSSTAGDKHESRGRTPRKKIPNLKFQRILGFSYIHERR